MQLTTDKKARKERPIARGFLDYFPLAAAEVSNVSHVGNQQHNPGEEMHWARDKSRDHADCIARHLIERGTTDDDGLRHTAKLAWRAMALLQLELEGENVNQNIPQDSAWQPKAEQVASPGYPEDTRTVAAINGSGNPEVTGSYLNLAEHTHASQPISDSQRIVAAGIARGWPIFMIELSAILFGFGVSAKVVKQIVGGTSHGATIDPVGYVYIAGPMRGYEKFNFPAFDAARDQFKRRGYVVTSPADIDRADEPDAENQPAGDQKVYAYRDFATLLMLAYTGKGCIAMLRGWEHSTGATAEFFLARWLGLSILDAETGFPLSPDQVLRPALENSVAIFLKGQRSK